MNIQSHIEQWEEMYKPDHIEKQYDNDNCLRGTLLVFGNLGVSIQWGAGSYSDNYDLYFDYKTPPSYTAEVAIWYKGSGRGYYLNPAISPIRTARLLMLPDNDTVTYKSEYDEIQRMVEVCRDYARA